MRTPHRLLSSLLLTLLLAASASPSTARTRPASPTFAGPDFFGTELFRGIYFGRGPIGQQLPEIWRASVPNPPASLQTDPGLAAAMNHGADSLDAIGQHADAAVIRNIANVVATRNPPVSLTPHQNFNDTLVAAVMSDIQASDGTFFSRFGERIMSGDLVQVSQALREGGSKILDVMDPASPGIAVETYVSANIAVNTDLVVNEEVAAIYWVVANTAVAASLAVFINLFLVVPIATNGGSALQGDAVTALIAGRFGPAATHVVPALSGPMLLLAAFAALVVVLIVVLRKVG